MTRTRCAWLSPMNTLPSLSTHKPCSRASWHLSGSPSGPSPSVPVPAMSSSVPRFMSTMRTLWLSVSARYTLPLGATAMPFGPDNVASFAGPPWPVKPFFPVPAMC